MPTMKNHSPTFEIQHDSSQSERNETPSIRPAGLLQPTALPTKSFQQMVGNILGPFQQSATHIWWIIIARGYFTGYAEDKALPYDTETEATKLFVVLLLCSNNPSKRADDKGKTVYPLLSAPCRHISTPYTVIQIFG